MQRERGRRHAPCGSDGEAERRPEAMGAQAGLGLGLLWAAAWEIGEEEEEM